MIEWGVSFGSHDAALAVFEDSKLVFASSSERFSKLKDDPDLHSDLIAHAVRTHGNPSRIHYHENHLLKRLRYLRSGQLSHVFEPAPTSALKNLGIDAPVTSVHHHLSHASAGYLTSHLSNATIVVMDAIGELDTTSIWTANGNTITKVWQNSYPHSMGLFYSALTDAVGLKPNQEEYILMGMAAYGDPTALASVFKEKLLHIDKRGPGFKLLHNLHRGCKHLLPSGCDPNDVAAAGQKIYEMVLRHILEWAWVNLPSKNLVLMGGCALNCVANSRIMSWNRWANVWIMPNPGDAGSAVGAVLGSRSLRIDWPGPYLGYEISGAYPREAVLHQLNIRGMAAVANGKAEFGPRALGNRSILADPRIPDMKQRMNWLKRREQFRPFAAVIPAHLASTYFDMRGVSESPYMQFVFNCKQPTEYPAITHVDGTCRIQTVTKAQHEGLFDTLMAWYDATGCPMLVNTSLNIKGQPLVNDLKDCLEWTKNYGVPVFT